jgi:DNA uptake protein ComE-like DNA-binding protein
MRLFAAAALLLLAPAPQSAKLDLNTATFTQLRALPGMGDEYARRVLRFRPYRAKNELSTRGILPEAEYARIQNLIVAHRVPETDKTSPRKK